jgi:hypothetical protein
MRGRDVLRGRFTAFRCSYRSPNLCRVQSGFRLRLFSRLGIENRQIFQDSSAVGMVCPESLLSYGQRPPVQWLCCRVPALGFIKQSRVIERRRHTGMIRAKGLLQDRQRSLGQRLRLLVQTLGFVNQSNCSLLVGCWLRWRDKFLVFLIALDNIFGAARVFRSLCCLRLGISGSTLGLPE